MADAGRVISRLKQQVGELHGENAILSVELEETREELARVQTQLVALQHKGDAGESGIAAVPMVIGGEPAQ